MRVPRRFQPILPLFAFALLPTLGFAQDLSLTPSDPDGVYDLGATAEWSVKWSGPAAEATYTIKRNGLNETRTGKLALSGEAASLDATLSEPGAVLAIVETTGADGKKVRGVGGAVAGVPDIEPVSPRPDDFDEFWESKIAELQAVPMNPVLTPGESGKAGVEYHSITLDNIRGTKIRGQLARPATGDKFPALLVVQWAGIYPLQKTWATDRAAEGWLTLNINAHDLPINEPESFYKEQSAGPLADYVGTGNDDRDTSYFLRMYLGAYRAADYLASRPDWDGRVLVVSGTSQGGQQTLVTAGLHPKITAAMANVPAGCDMRGPDGGRHPGWPMWYWQVKSKDAEKVRRASEYYDVVHFASRIKVPTLIGVALADETCPPAGVFAAANQVQGPTEVVVLPLADHQGKNNTHQPYYARWGAWAGTLRHGNPAPVQEYKLETAGTAP